MDQDRKPSIPPKLIALDALGMFMAGIGLAKHVAGIDVIPLALRFDNYAFVFIVAGFALAIPGIVHLIGTARKNSA